MSREVAPLGLSEKQQLMRQSGIGASEVWDVLRGGIATYARKVGEAEPFEGTDLTEFGHRIEPIISDAWVARHPGLRTYTPGTLTHPVYPWALATLDRVVAPPGVGRPARKDWIEALEIKTVFHSGSEYGEEEVPERHLIQVQWQLEVAALEKATLVALVNGAYREFPISRDRELGGMLIELVGRFWTECVEAHKPPPVDGSAAYSEFLRRRHPRDSGPLLMATPVLRDLVAMVREAKAAVKAAKASEDLAVNQLRAEIGDAQGIEGLCTWRANKESARTDWEAVAGELLARAPEEERTRLIEQYTTTSPGARVLRLAKEK